jgi:hypothetical protein
VSVCNELRKGSFSNLKNMELIFEAVSHFYCRYPWFHFLRLKPPRILLTKSAGAHAGRVRLAQEAAHDQPLSS